MKAVASLHGANGVVMDIIECPPDNVEGLFKQALAKWRQSIASGCRVVIGVCDEIPC